ncbi:MAG: urea ABC transporter permease subunit UrtB, partial [Pseudomonadota bacterium]
MFRSFLMALAQSLALSLVLPASAIAGPLQDILQTHADEVLKPGRRSVGVVLDDLVESGLPEAVTFLEAWRDREIVQRDADGLFFRTLDDVLFDLDTGAEVGPDEDTTASRPNGGVRRAIGDALVQFQLSDPDIIKRRAAVEA